MEVQKARVYKMLTSCLRSLPEDPNIFPASGLKCHVLLAKTLQMQIRRRGCSASLYRHRDLVGS
jgi:hypothetical protein